MRKYITWGYVLAQHFTTVIRHVSLEFTGVYVKRTLNHLLSKYQKMEWVKCLPVIYRQDNLRKDERKYYECYVEFSHQPSMSFFAWLQNGATRTTKIWKITWTQAPCDLSSFRLPCCAVLKPCICINSPNCQCYSMSFFLRHPTPTALPFVPIGWAQLVALESAHFLSKFNTKIMYFCTLFASLCQTIYTWSWERVHRSKPATCHLTPGHSHQWPVIRREQASIPKEGGQRDFASLVSSPHSCKIQLRCFVTYPWNVFFHQTRVSGGSEAPLYCDCGKGTCRHLFTEECTCNNSKKTAMVLTSNNIGAISNILAT